MVGNSIDESKDSDRSLEGTSKGTASVLPSPFDTYEDDVDDDYGLSPSQLYGRYTWKLDKFSQINKRELRSNAFEVGGYKWYVLLYPQGCDVCDHLSLFLCVANHDRLLPGWQHFAQFTVAVVNKDPKRSKYSDTLHRFWKKEHDWGWKKFMQSSKLLDGSYLDADTLIIKVQVQVIRERSDYLFRCLDRQYRRELLRVYSSNVEQVCQRFIVETGGKLKSLVADRVGWSCFNDMWLGFDEKSRHQFSRMKLDLLSKLLVKCFFVEKEVTSTLLMDLLYFGLSSLKGQTKSDKVKEKCVVWVESDALILVDDVLPLLERAAIEPLPTKHDNDLHSHAKDGGLAEKDIEKDERRLVELGQRVIELYVLAHISSKIEVECREALALKRQEELIREEENDREKAKVKQKQKPKPKLKRAS